MKTPLTFIKMLAVVAIAAAAMSSAEAAIIVRPQLSVAPEVVAPVAVAPAAVLPVVAAPLAVAPVYVPTCRWVAVPVVNAWTGLTYIRTRRFCN